MKCPPCEKNKCKGAYENRHMCDGGDCNCVCQITVLEEVFEKGVPIVAGAALTGASVALAVAMPLNPLALGASGALGGAGGVLIAEPIGNLIERERVDNTGMMKRAGGAAIVGGLTGVISKRECKLHIKTYFN
jgi:hypothetical protein